MDLTLSTVGLYRIHHPVHLTDDELLEKLQEKFTDADLSSYQVHQKSWAAPAGRLHSALMMRVMDHRVLTFLHRKKELSAGLVKAMTDARVQEFEDRHSKVASSQTRSDIRDQVKQELLPTTPVTEKRITVWWDTRDNLVGVGAGSEKVRLDVLDFLRETLDGLSVAPVKTTHEPTSLLTAWVRYPDRLEWATPTRSVVFSSTGAYATRFTGSKVDLTSEEVAGMLDHYYEVTKLSLETHDETKFSVDHNLVISGLAFHSEVMHGVESANDGDPLSRFQAMFSLYAYTLRDLTTRMFREMGGEISTPEDDPALIKQRRAEAKEEKARLKEEAKAEKARLKAEAREEKARLKAEAREEKARIRAEAKEEKARLRAEARDEEQLTLDLLA
tara:strand:- start:5985 stop:7148 length:1164 start_codon:yes stop_codon:yes gene_type:complete